MRLKRKRKGKGVLDRGFGRNNGLRLGDNKLRLGDNRLTNTNKRQILKILSNKKVLRKGNKYRKIVRKLNKNRKLLYLFRICGKLSKKEPKIRKTINAYNNYSIFKNYSSFASPQHPIKHLSPSPTT